MSDLPIDSEAIAACDKAEHAYGERLMDAATKLAMESGRESVTAADIQDAEFWAAGNVEEPLMLGTKDGMYMVKQGQFRCICAEKYGRAKE